MKKTLIFTIVLLILLPIVLADPEGWGDDTRLTFDLRGSFTSSSSLAVDSEDNVHIVWRGYGECTPPPCSLYGYDIYYKKLDNQGRGLTPTIRVSFDPNQSWNPSVAIDPHDNVHIVWYDNRDGNYEVYYRNLDNNGNPLSNEIRLTSSNGDSKQPRIAVDRQSNLHITWQDNRDGNIEVYYKKLDNNGTSLTPDIRITNSTGSSESPTIATDLDGNVHLTWSDNREGNNEVYYKKLDNYGRSLTNDLRLTFTQDNSDSPSLAIGTNNDVNVGWREGTSLVYYKRLDSFGNNLTSNIQVTPGSNKQGLTLDVDRRGDIYFFWEDEYGGDEEIVYTKIDNNGRTIVGETRLTRNEETSIWPSVDTDFEGNVHVAWADAREEQFEIYYKRSLPPQITILGLPVISNIVDIALLDPLNSNRPYALGMSLGTSGISLSDGRIVHLSPDILFFQSISNPSALGLSNATGRLNSQGRATVQFRIPDVPEIVNLSLYLGFVTIEPTAPVPHTIVSISLPANMTLRPILEEYGADNHTQALWHFDEGNNSIVYDETTNHNDGILQNGAFFTTNYAPVQGNNYAIRFAGNNEYIEVNHSASLINFNRTFTLEAWIKTTNTRRAGIVTKHPPTPYRTRDVYGLWIGGEASGISGVLNFFLFDSNGNVVNFDGNAFVADGQWHHVAAVRNNDNFLIYVDGRLDASRTVSSIVDVRGTATLNIGRSDAFNGQYFDGFIDEVRISNKAREPSEFNVPL